MGRLPQEQIGTSTADIPGGNLSILILNRKSTAHNHNQHAGNIGSTCAHLRKAAAGRAPPEPGTRNMAGTQNAHHTHNTKHTQHTHKCTTQHSTEHTQHTHNIAQHTTAQNGTHEGRLHTEHTTQTTHKTHTKQAHTEHTTNTPHTPREHTHNQATQARTHTHILPRDVRRQEKRVATRNRPNRIQKISQRRLDVF